MQIIPYWGVADSVLQQKVDEIRSERLRAFFDELAAGKQELDDEIIQQENFLHCYFSTLRAALNTRRREKIKLFAKLLKSSTSKSTEGPTDEYEEILESLDSISYREFCLLYELRKLETSVQREKDENQLEHLKDDAMITTIKLLYKMISDLTKIKQERRREVFVELIKPIFEKFIEIHTDYFNMFSKVSKELPFSTEKNSWVTESGFYNFNEIEAKKKIDSIILEFMKERKKGEFIRDWLRNDTKEILLSIKYDDEKRFLFTILNYFIRQLPPDLSDTDLDRHVKYIIEDKARHSFDTPSSSLAWQLNKNPENAKEIVDRSVAKLNCYFFRVSSAYIKLKMVISTK